MRQAASLVLILCWSLCSVANPYAQTIPLESYGPGTLVLEKYNLLQVNSLELDSSSLKPAHSPERENSITKPIRTRMQPDDILLKIKNMHDSVVNRAMFSKLYSQPNVDEKKMIREEWKKALGMDVWSPYYKVRDIEKRIKKKLGVKIFKFKGEPEFSKKKFIYSFNMKF